MAAVPKKRNERSLLASLKKIDFLAGLSVKEFAKLAEVAEYREARRRRVVYMPGDPGTKIFFVIAGRIKISRVTPDGKELTLGYRSPGDLLGELSVFEGYAREEMVEVVDDVLLLELPRESFAELLETNGTLAFAMVQLQTVRRRKLERKIEDLIFRDVNSKLAELLLDASKKYGVKEMVGKQQGTLLKTRLTHQEMANLIGSTRETVSLTLAQFKKKSLITSISRKVIVLNHEGLRSLL